MWKNFGPTIALVVIIVLTCVLGFLACKGRVEAQMVLLFRDALRGTYPDSDYGVSDVGCSVTPFDAPSCSAAVYNVHTQKIEYVTFSGRWYFEKK